MCWQSYNSTHREDFSAWPSRTTWLGDQRRDKRRRFLLSSSVRITSSALRVLRASECNSRNVESASCEGWLLHLDNIRVSRCPRRHRLQAHLSVTRRTRGGTCTLSTRQVFREAELLRRGWPCWIYASWRINMISW